MYQDPNKIYYTTKQFKDITKDQVYEIVKSNKDTCWLKIYVNGFPTGEILKRIPYSNLRVLKNQ